MSRRLIVIGLILVGLLGLGLFQVKLAVEEQDHQLDALYRAQLEDQKAIHVLEAEWAFLNSPDRLQDLAIRHLRLAPTLPTQVIQSPADIPYRAGGQSERDPGSIYPAPRAKPLLRYGEAGSATEEPVAATTVSFSSDGEQKQ